MKQNALKRKAVSTETSLEENFSFEVISKGSYEGKLEKGVLVPNGGSIIVGNQSGINGKIPGITNIWLSANYMANNHFTIHVRGRCPKGKENILLEFYDEGGTVYKMIIYPHFEEQIHILHYSSNCGDLIKIKWTI